MRRSLIAVIASVAALGGPTLLTATATATATATTPTPATTPAPALAVFPMPGAQVAAPQTQITFRGLPISQLGTVTVTGSRSGAHSGHLQADSDNQGGSFLPDKPFTPGETVTVKTSQTIIGAQNGTFSFRVATPVGPIPRGSALRFPRAKGDVTRFRTRPDLQAPTVRIVRGSTATAPGDIFLAPQLGPVSNGAEIVDNRGNLVFFRPSPRGMLDTDVRVQQLNGKPVLTYWQGYLSPTGVGSGQDFVLDQSYKTVSVVKAGNGLTADLHEFQLTPQGTALITAYYPVVWNASSVHGSRHQVVYDSVVQEIDIPTGLVLFQWDALDHIPMSDTYVRSPRAAGFPFDAYHFNSVDRDHDGDLIISARNTWTAYKVSEQTGRIAWQLGGKHSTFRIPSSLRFAFQHDVRVRAANDRFLTVFDDGAGPPVVHKQARALKLVLDLRHHTVRLAAALQHNPPLQVNFEGNVQQLPGGDNFVGWGGSPYFTEFNRRGRVVFDGRFVNANTSYRVYRFPWNAAPAYPPIAAAARSGSSMLVWVSWNGATNVHTWRVLAGASPDSLAAVASSSPHGFETLLRIPSNAYVAVQALDHSGNVLAQSKTVTVAAH